MPYCVSLNCPQAEAELLLAALLDYPTLGVIEKEPAGGRVSLEIFVDSATAAQALLSRFPNMPASVQPCSPEQVSAPALPDWQPLCVGERFFLAPPWRDDPTPPGRIRLPMPPGDAYGTGMHAPTQIMLIALERHLRPGDVMLDLGTGSGILSAAAAALGARRVYACDIDLDAVRSAARYLGGSAVLFAGSAAGLAGACVDLVAANIDAPTILDLLPQIRRLLRPGGRAVLSGFAVEERPSLEDRLAETGFEVVARFTRQEWAGLAAVISEAQHGC
jgi:ribosomal protein L11 methyltransferase